MHPRSRRLDLREATHDIHERLDGTVGAWADLRAYARYLSAMAAFRMSVETALTQVGVPDAWSYRPIFIAADLQADRADLRLTGPLVAPPFPPIPGRSGLLGTLYVLEGSGFGARILRQRAAELGLGDAHGARHLARMAAGAGHWREFLAVLEAEPAYDPEAARAGAEATFATALHCFEGATRVAA